MADSACPACGKQLPPDAPHGLCPQCLLLGALGTGVSAAPDAFTDEPVWTDGTTVKPPPGIDEIAAFFPQLEILELLGYGGMGAVYKARQRELDRLVALKVLSPRLQDDPAFSERFTREARALARLNHPGIVTLYESGHAGRTFYFLMEYVEGVNLGQLLQSGRLAPREALAIVPQICEALQYAHDRGIVHRDIKPHNILLSREGQVKIADFGVAKLMDAEAQSNTPKQMPQGDPHAPVTPLTQSGATAGTPRYMAPEQISSPLDVDHRADIYSLGVVFYQMLTGEAPRGNLEPPSRKVTIDVRLDEVVLRALDQQPERRYQHVSEMREQVETIAATLADGQGRQTAPPGTSPASPARAVPVHVTVLRWGARVIGSAISLLIGVFVLGEGLPAIGSQPGGVQIGFLGLWLMVLGAILAWRREGVGALLLMLGWVIKGVAEGHPELGFITPFPLAGALYAYCWWYGGGRKSGRVIAAAAVVLTAMFLVGRCLVPAKVLIHGQVLNAITAAPVPDAQLSLNTASLAKPQKAPQVITNKQGHFVLYLGWYCTQDSLTFTAPGYQPLTVQLGPKPYWSRRLDRTYKMTPMLPAHE